MSISTKEIKKLWALSAGRCAFKGCSMDCIPFLDDKKPTVIGKMAHVIANSPQGPRGDGVGGDNSYENLMLLCPNHHDLIDAVPERYPRELLLKWKAEHEAHVRESLRPPAFVDRTSLNAFVRHKLIANLVCWKTYGPESEVAKATPNSSLAFIWPFRKLSLIIPNNRRIIVAINRNMNLFSENEYATACMFIEHAEGFERSSISPVENVPRFPRDFQGLFNER